MTWAGENELTELVPVAAILSFGSPRLGGENAQHIRMLAQSDVPLPPIVVHRPTMTVIDGLHRLRAAALRGENCIEVRFVGGAAEDAFVLAVKLNTRQGMPLSHADRTAAAARIIGTHAHWSDRRIAEVVGLSPGAVGALRVRSTDHAGQSKVRMGRDGRVRPLNTADARRRAGWFILNNPDASLREIAEVAGVAVATARDVRNRLNLGEDPVPLKLRVAEEREAAGGCPPETGVPVPAPLPPQPGIILSVLSNMRKDPSLRFTDAGRTLLKLLGSQAMGADRWRWLVENVPAHRVPDVAQFARQCAEQWTKFARELERRSTDPGEKSRCG